jgi:hypothetical protein
MASISNLITFSFHSRLLESRKEEFIPLLLDNENESLKMNPSPMTSSIYSISSFFDSYRKSQYLDLFRGNSITSKYTSISDSDFIESPKIRKQYSQEINVYLRTIPIKQYPEGLANFIYYYPCHQSICIFQGNHLWIINTNETENNSVISHCLSFMDGFKESLINCISTPTPFYWIINIQSFKDSFESHSGLYELVYSPFSKTITKTQIFKEPSIHKILLYWYIPEKEEIIGIGIFNSFRNEKTGYLFKVFKDYTRDIPEWSFNIFQEHPILLNTHDESILKKEFSFWFDSHTGIERVFQFYSPYSQIMEYSITKTKIQNSIYRIKFDNVYFLRQGWIAGFIQDTSSNSNSNSTSNLRYYETYSRKYSSKPNWKEYSPEHQTNLYVLHSQHMIPINISIETLPFYEQVIKTYNQMCFLFKNVDNGYNPKHRIIEVLSLDWGFMIIQCIPYFKNYNTNYDSCDEEQTYSYFMSIGVVTWDDLNRFSSMYPDSVNESITYQIEWNHILFSVRSFTNSPPLFHFQCDWLRLHHYGVLSIYSTESYRHPISQSEIDDSRIPYKPREGYSIIATLRYIPNPSRFKLYPIKSWYPSIGSSFCNDDIVKSPRFTTHTIRDDIYPDHYFPNEVIRDIEYRTEEEKEESEKQRKIYEEMEFKNKRFYESFKQNDSYNSKAVYASHLIPTNDSSMILLNSWGIHTMKMCSWGRRDSILLWRESVNYYKTRIMYPQIKEDAFKRFYREVSKRRQKGEYVTIEQVSNE